MSDMPDWLAWILAAVLLALFGWYFWHTGRTMFDAMRHLISTIENWPQIRRAMVDAEARTPRGRYPFWFRAIRVVLILALVGLLVLVLWRKFT
ncbi:hypothetical protein [Devosia sp.]|uniref:hypothetical protein n=1 Tax=Devosia sp. TaxID=1871048 RepID=UPI003BAC1FE1